jgi:hypothetical protein
MNFGSSRLGFWYNKPADRGYKNKIGVFYDPLTNGPGGNTDYYNSGDANPPVNLYPNLAARISALGYTPSLITSYSALKALNLYEYAQLWDIGYASPYLTNPNDPTAILTSYLQGGGAMFIMGENSNFGVRDDSVDTFITGLGGGNVVRGTTDYPYSVNVTLQAEFLLSNNSNSVDFARPGVFSQVGSGTPMTTAFVDNEYVAAMWTTGSLLAAPTGTVMSILDVNFLKGSYPQNDFIDNTIISLNRK